MGDRVPWRDQRRGKEKETQLFLGRQQAADRSRGGGPAAFCPSRHPVRVEALDGTAKRLGLEYTLRARGRPKKNDPGGEKEARKKSCVPFFSHESRAPKIHPFYAMNKQAAA